MLKQMLSFGLIAGVVSGAPLFALTVAAGGAMPSSFGMVLGYLTMLVALSAVFVAVKRRRDRELGGVIGFWPAFGMGLAISAVAGVLYALMWEAALAISGLDFGAQYAKAVIEEKIAAGVQGAELERVRTSMESFRVQYANPLYRVPMSISEILPVGVLVSLVTAALLRNPRFMAARAA